jgi:hypothetical protein
MKRTRWLWAPVIALILIVLGTAAIVAYSRGRPLPIPTSQRLFTGVVYSRRVALRPRPMIMHVITVDMRTPGLRLLVTPPDEKGSGTPLRARTTSQFMQISGVQIAINGDGFYPWWSRSLADYYPHEGDPVHPRGFTASQGKVYWTTDANFPTLYISSRGSLSFDAPAHPYNAISGDPMLVSGGTQMPNLDDTDLHPRTAVGYARNGRYLYLVVVDGRQPFYSEGITLKELADVMVSLGSQYAMNLDGGGSSTIVVEGADGIPRVLNSPIDNYIPGRERPVADHLGIYVGSRP